MKTMVKDLATWLVIPVLAGIVVWLWQGSVMDWLIITGTLLTVRILVLVVRHRGEAHR